MTVETNVIEGVPERFRDEAEDTRSPLVETLEAVETGLKEGVHEAGVKVEDTAESVSETLEAAGHAVQGAVRGTGDAFRGAFDFPGRVVQRHPWLALGAAALAALLLVRLLRRD